MEIDVHDIMALEEWDTIVQQNTTHLIKCMDTERRWEIVCIQFLKGHQIAQSLSLKAKLIELRCKTESGEVEDAVDAWITATYETHKAELSLKQAEGQRDSIKKKLSVIPK